MLVEIRCVRTHILVRERGGALVQLALLGPARSKVHFDAHSCYGYVLCVCSFMASFGGWIKVIEKCERECFFSCFRTVPARWSSQPASHCQSPKYHLRLFSVSLYYYETVFLCGTVRKEYKSPKTMCLFWCFLRTRRCPGPAAPWRQRAHRRTSQHVFSAGQCIHVHMRAVQRGA